MQLTGFVEYAIMSFSLCITSVLRSHVAAIVKQMVMYIVMPKIPVEHDSSKRISSISQRGQLLLGAGTWQDGKGQQ